MSPNDRSETCVVPLPALDGANPIGLFAALGALALLDPASSGAVRLSWTRDGGWRPRLHLAAPITAPGADIDENIPDEAPLEQRRLSWALSRALVNRRGEPALALRWGEGDSRHLRAPRAAMRAHAIATRAEGDELSQRLVGALSAEVQTTSGGVVLSPTAFEFSGGQQVFVETGEDLLESTSRVDVHAALFGPPALRAGVKTFNYDATNARDHALRASDPSGSKKESAVGASALALYGLAAFPVQPTRRHNQTTAVSGGYEDAELTWALWGRPATWDAARAIIALSGLADMSGEERRARGILTVFSSRRAWAGYYGGFAPTAPV